MREKGERREGETEREREEKYTIYVTVILTRCLPCFCQDGAKAYMRNHNVPQKMQRRVQRWYDYAWSRWVQLGNCAWLLSVITGDGLLIKQYVMCARFRDCMPMHVGYRLSPDHQQQVVPMFSQGLLTTQWSEGSLLCIQVYYTYSECCLARQLGSDCFLISQFRGRMNGGGDINSLGLLPDKLKTELALHVNLETLKKVESQSLCCLLLLRVGRGKESMTYHNCSWK